MSQFWAIYKKVDFIHLLCPLLLKLGMPGQALAWSLQINRSASSFYQCLSTSKKLKTDINPFYQWSKNTAIWLSESFFCLKLENFRLKFSINAQKWQRQIFRENSHSPQKGKKGSKNGQKWAFWTFAQNWVISFFARNDLKWSVLWLANFLRKSHIW